MEHTTLGRSAMTVSKICLGTMCTAGDGRRGSAVAPT